MVWGMLNEVGRKIIHIMILLVLGAYFLIEEYLVNVGYNADLAKQVALMSLLLLLIVFLVLEYFRLELGWKMGFFGVFIRPKEQNRMYGSIYFLSSTIISLAVFNKNIAIAALLMTTFGDMVAALVGKKYGTSIVYRNKTWAGFFAELATNLAVGFLLLDNIWIIIGMAAVATVVETLVDELDDNLIIPLFAGFVGQIIFFSL